MVFLNESEYDLLTFTEEHAGMARSRDHGTEIRVPNDSILGRKA